MKSKEWFGVYFSDLYVYLYRTPNKIIRETAQFIIDDNSTRWKKHTKYDKWFPSLKEAQDFAVKVIDEKVDYLGQQRQNALAVKATDNI
jgi:hypothetical protein